VKPGSSVPLVVAAPLPRVPSLVGKSEASAIRSLKNAGFKVKKTTKTRTTGQDGVVLSQSPTKGTPAKPNSVVRIVISNVQRSPDAGITSNCTPGYTPCLPPPRTMTVLVAQPTDPSTPDPSASPVPTRTT
jgi:resuscitation-promoting factor RpfB